MLSFIRSRESGVLPPWELKEALYEESLKNYAAEPHATFPKVHVGAVNSLSVENVDQRYLLSGGADSSIRLWDLELDARKDWKSLNSSDGVEYSQLANIDRQKGHKYGVSHVQWWPHDSGLFVTTSFDGTAKVWDTNTMQEAYKFDLGTRIYSADISTVGEHAMVATAADHPFVRLLDLRTTAAAQILKGHEGKVLTTKWSPTHGSLIATGGTDGSVRLWDVRRSDSCVLMLDHTLTPTAQANPLRRGVDKRLSHPRAHRAAANGLCWMPDGSTLLSFGNDEKLRLWDLLPPEGMNKLVNYGPFLRNKFLQTINPCLMFQNHETHKVMVPSDSGEIFMYQVEDGKMVCRLSRGHDVARSACVTGRGYGYEDYFSGSLDGKITRWSPHYERPTQALEDKNKKKRGVLDDIHDEMKATERAKEE